MYVRTAIEKSHHYAAAFSGHAVPQFEDFAEFLVEKKGQAFLIVQDMVEEGIELGELRSEIDPVLAAKSIWASCHGLATLMIHLPHFPGFHEADAVIDRDDFINFHANQPMRGLEVT